MRRSFSVKTGVSESVSVTMPLSCSVEVVETTWPSVSILLSKIISVADSTEASFRGSDAVVEVGAETLGCELFGT